MKRYKRIMSLALSVVMALLATLCFSGCFEEEELILSTYGDFIITQHNKIYDLSEEGLQKEYIIVPEKINGDYTEVYTITEGILLAGRSINPFTKSEKLKKVYFEIDLTHINNTIINGYANMILDFRESIRTNFVIKQKLFNLSSFINVFSYQNTYISYKNKVEIDGLLNGMHHLSNIQFMYNYEGAPNEGYYWIDDLETGETLSYMPKDPTREGYIFGGWYADSECTTPYDFTAPYVKKEYVPFDRTSEDISYGKYPYNYPKNYVTYIHAKWIEN